MRVLATALVIALFPSLQVGAQPPNDTCANALLVGVGSTPFDTTAATTATSALPTCQFFSEKEIWFEYVASSDIVVRFDTLGSSFNTVLTAYENNGCPPGPTDELKCNDNLNGTTSSAVFFPATSGLSYLIRVSGTGTMNSGVGVLNVEELPTPSNDDCSSPLPLNVPDSIAFDTAAATASLNFSCPMGLDLWYEVIAPATGLLVVDKDILVHHAIYPISVPGECPTTLADEIYCTLQEHTATPVVGGGRYLIRLAPNVFDENAAIGTLDISFVTQALNDDCTSAMPFPLGSSLAIDTIAATTDPSFLVTCNLPPFGDELCHSDLWYSVTPATDGVLTVNLPSDPQATPLHVVYELPAGLTCPTTADEINCSQPSDSATPVLAGQTYFVRIGNFIHSHFYQGTITIDVASPIVNDECTNAAPLASGIPFPLDTNQASISSGYSCVIEGDLWYQFTAPGDGFLHTELEIDEIGSHVVYHAPGGACPTNADELICAQFTDVSTVSVLSGEVYLTRVSGTQFAGPVTGTITATFETPPLNDDCATPELIAAPASISFNTIAASGTPGLSGCLGSPVVKDLWYEYTPPVSGQLTLDFDTNVIHSLYTSTSGAGCPTNGQFVFCENAPFFSTTAVTGGQTYLLRVGHFDGSPGAMGTFTVDLDGPPSNDDCATGNAEVIPSIPSITNWDTAGATDDTNGLTGGPTCSLGPFHDVWFQFVAPTSGVLEFDFTVGGNGFSSFVIYEDPSGGVGCPTDANAIACRQGGDSDTFAVIAGESYYARVGRGGSSSPVFSGAFSLDYTLSDPSLVMCDASVADQVTATYTIPVGSSYDLGVEVFVDGIQVATIPETQLSYTHNLPVGFVGLVEIGFRGLSSAGTTATVACDAAFGGPSNNLCSSASVVSIGTHAFDNQGASTDSFGPPFSCGSGSHDLWYEFTPIATGLHRASTCGTTQMDSVIEIYDGTSGCPVPGDLAIACVDNSVNCPLSNAEVEWTATGGTTYYVRLGGGNAFNGSTGTGDLIIQEDCAALTGLTCQYDCSTNEIAIDWDGGSHLSYEIVASPGGSLASGLAGPPFVGNLPATGSVTITVSGQCANGATSTAFCEVYSVDPSLVATDLVLQLESPFGIVDSTTALATALVANGKSPVVVPLVDFGASNCLELIADPIERVWVMAGTFPEDYRLTAADGNALAAFLASGKAVYLESGDHWGFQHVSSMLDNRDGVGLANDGNNSFTSMNGFDSGVANGDFSGFSNVPYQHDSFTNDSTDQISAVTSDPVLDAGTIWRNNPDTAGMEPEYGTGVLAIHTGDGGTMISCSWEFGGFGGDQDSLMQAYLAAFPLPPTPSLPLVRGDCNVDGSTNIADAVSLLAFLFPQGAPITLSCDDACDSNDDENLNIADAVTLLNSLFGMPPVVLPAPSTCDVDPTGPAGIDCASFSACP